MATATAADPWILAPGPWPLALARGPTRAGATGPLLKAKVGDCFANVILDALKQATVCTGGHTMDELPS